MKLEDINEKDTDDIIKLTKLKSVMKYVGNGKIWDSDKVDRFIGYNLKEVGSKNRREYYYKITDNKFVGIIGVHPFLSFKGYYLSVMLLPSEQRKGYYRKSIEKLKDKIKKEGIKTDRIKILVRTNNKRMISLSEKNYYFNRERHIKGESFYEFFYFLRKYTYLILSNNSDKKIVNEIFSKRGNWKEYNQKGKESLDYIYIYGEFKFNTSLYNKRCLLKNISDYKEEGKITNKNKLFQNLEKIKGGKKYIVDNFKVDLENINHNKVEDLFKKYKILIFKPIYGYKGTAIEVLTSYEKFVEFVNREDYFKQLKKLNEGKLSREKMSQWVLQEYINNPLLIDNKKFHIRLYYLVHRDEKYLLNDGLIFTAISEYKREDYTNKDIHDTHSYYRHADDVLKYPKDLKFLGSKIQTHIHNQIIDLFNKVGEIDNFGCYPESKDCYRLLGPDIMITDDYQVKVLEINGVPGIPTIKSKFGRKLFENEISLMVDSTFPPQNKIEEDNDFIQVY